MSDHQVESSVLALGLERARLRFVESEPGSEDAFIAVFEVLAWFGSIRDRLKFDGLERPPVLDGLYYMRNVVIHQGADVLGWLLFFDHGSSLGAAKLGAVKLGSSVSRTKVWHWPLQGEFDPPQSRAGKTEYETLLAGEDVSRTIEDAVAAIRDVWALSGHSDEAAES